MKIKPEHYAHIRDAIAAIPPENIEAHKALLARDERVKDFDTRFRWDTLHACVPSAWICDNLYPYMNDKHLDSALRKIMVEVFPTSAS